jgi:hypothetical protein
MQTSLLKRCQKFHSSPPMRSLRSVEDEELRARCFEIYRNLSDWLLLKTHADIEQRYRQVGDRARQGVYLAEVIWGIVLTRNISGHSWNAKALYAVSWNSMANLSFCASGSQFLIGPCATSPKAMKGGESRPRSRFLNQEDAVHVPARHSAVAQFWLTIVAGSAKEASYDCTSPRSPHRASF